MTDQTRETERPDAHPLLEPEASGSEARGDGAKSRAAPESEKGGIIATIGRHPVLTGLVLVAVLAAAVTAILWYLNARHFESTDDAFVDGRIVSISPEVTGAITAVAVSDNQVVRAGELLAQIDQRNFSAAVAQAEAQSAQAEAMIENYIAQAAAQREQVEAADRQIEVAQAQLNFSIDENKRYQQEVQSGAGTAQRAQQSAADLEAKRAMLFAAQDARAAASGQIEVLQAQRKSAEAQKAQAVAQMAAAEANLSRTVLRAPVDGRVTRLTAALGQLATQGQALMLLVPLDLWVTANFKETQLVDIRVGQPVDIAIDSFGRTYPGHVDSIQAGSGTAFSLLPAENATGNYVKVVQRVPTKITFDHQPDVEIGPGMSVEPNVRVR
jgi:membrane fusion protein (multidrug efflux system)